MLVRLGRSFLALFAASLCLSLSLIRWTSRWQFPRPTRNKTSGAVPSLERSGNPMAHLPKILRTLATLATAAAHILVIWLF